MDIAIKNQQTRIPLNPTQLIKISKKILNSQRVKHASLSIVFVSDKQIKAINKKFLKCEYATDVLAFDLRDGFGIPLKKIKAIEGEIIISTETAIRQAKLYATDIFEELVLYLVHGILHLLGYDDHTDSDIKRMRKKERQIMRLLNFSKGKKLSIKRL